MEEKAVPFESDHIGDTTAINHGWQKVTYPKRHKKHPPKPSDSVKPTVPGESIFQSLEKHSEDRRRRIEAQRAAISNYEAPIRIRSSKHGSSDSDDENEIPVQNVAVEEKKMKPKKPKKPKLTIADAASKIDAADLQTFLAQVSESYQGHQEIQMMRFADYFGRAFSGVTASQFPWPKLFRDSSVTKIAHVPVSHISEAVYKASVDWINQLSYGALGSSVLWSLDSILADFARQQTGAKGSKKGGQQTPPKSQVAMFLVLAMVLRRKPDVLVNLLPILTENSKYQGQDKLPLIVWMATQACEGDLAVGLYSWAHHILPILGGKSGSNPQSRDLVLQLVERILSAPKARTILVNGAVRKGERLIPPGSFDLLLRVTFPSSSARVKATERFEAIYPVLKEVALAGSTGSKAMKQVAQQMLTFAVKAVGEGIPELSREATSIFIWCLTQNPECYKQWDKMYMDNLEASVAVLRKLTEDWKGLSAKQSSLEALRDTLRSFKLKNKKALENGVETAPGALFKDANKYCKVLLGRLSRGHMCMKSVALAMIALGVGIIVMPSDMESWDLNKFNTFLGTFKYQLLSNK